MKRVVSQPRVQWDAEFWAVSVLRKQAELPPAPLRGRVANWTARVYWGGRICAIPSAILGRAIWKRVRF